LFRRLVGLPLGLGLIDLFSGAQRDHGGQTLIFFFLCRRPGVDVVVAPHPTH